MRILYVTQYFPPEIGAGASRAKETVRYLASAGHRVTVLTEFPTYLVGVLASAYRNKIVAKERFEGTPVIRVRASCYGHRSMVKRLLSYLSFMLMAAMAGLANDANYDLVYASSPPPFVGLGAWIIALFKAKAFVFEARDIWPKAAVDAGILRNKYAVMLGQALENFCYARAKLIVAVTRGYIDELVKRGFRSSKIRLVENGVNAYLYRPGRCAEVRRRLGCKSRDFVVVYAGLLGHLQAPSVMLRAAQLLDSRENIRFLLIGEGIKKHQLKTHVAERGIKNVEFLPGLPENEVAKYLASCDAGIATLRKGHFFEICMPTKIFTYMACGLPVIVTARGEAREIVEKSGSGIATDPEDSEQLAEAILQMYHSPEAAREMGERGRQFVVRHYSRKDQAVKLERALLRLLE